MSAKLCEHQTARASSKRREAAQVWEAVGLGDAGYKSYEIEGQGCGLKPEAVGRAGAGWGRGALSGGGRGGHGRYWAVGSGGRWTHFILGESSAVHSWQVLDCFFLSRQPERSIVVGFPTTSTPKPGDARLVQPDSKV